MKKITILLGLLLPLLLNAQIIDSIVFTPSNPSPTDTIYAHCYGTKYMSNSKISRINTIVNQNVIQTNVYSISCGAGFAVIGPFDTIIELCQIPSGLYLIKTISCSDSNTIDSNCHLQPQVWCSDTLIHNLTVVSINDQNKDPDIHFRISPNPISETAIISFDREFKNVQLEMSDMYGRTIKSGIYINTKEIKLDANGIARGAYVLRVTLDNKAVETRKIIID